MRPGVEVRQVRPEDVDSVLDLVLAARAESSVGSQVCTAERDQLAQQLGTLTAVPGGTVLVAGEAGIGKTALLGATAERAAAAGMLVLPGRAAEHERDVPFGSRSTRSTTGR